MNASEGVLLGLWYWKVTSVGQDDSVGFKQLRIILHLRIGNAGLIFSFDFYDLE